MSKYYKVGLCVDAFDVPLIQENLDEIYKNVSSFDAHAFKSTPDNTYEVFYWEYVKWDLEPVRPLLKKLEGIRHSLITVSEEGEIWTDVLVSDSRGCDEEFYEVLSWNADICFWDNTPVNTVISKDRLAALLKSYITQDFEGMSETSCLRDAFDAAGFKEHEIEALGFGFCLPGDIFSDSPCCEDDICRVTNSGTSCKSSPEEQTECAYRS